jgi:DNA-binding Xre family transcriptional regulator
LLGLAFSFCQSVVLVSWSYPSHFVEVLGKAIALKFSRQRGDRLSCIISLKATSVANVKLRMGLIRLRVRELAAEKGWTLKDVSDRAGIPYSTVKNYAQAPSLATVDYTALQKLARVFDVMIDDLVEVLED